MKNLETIVHDLLDNALDSEALVLYPHHQTRERQAEAVAEDMLEYADYAFDDGMTSEELVPHILSWLAKHPDLTDLAPSASFKNR